MTNGRVAHLTPDELAARWGGMSTSNLQSMRTKGTGPAYIKTSKKIALYPLDEIEAFEQA